MRIIEVITTLPTITALAGDELRSHQQQVQQQQQARAKQRALALRAQRDLQRQRDRAWRERNRRVLRKAGKLRVKPRRTAVHVETWRRN
jgi:hypothetical protein